MFSQVNHLLTAILLVSFFLGVLFRFFLVLYAEGFLRKGSLNLKLFKQLYWLSWVAFVTLGLIPFAITPIMLGNFPTQNSYRKQLCLGVLVYEKNELDADPFGTRILMIIEFFYVLRFVRKVKSFVRGQCPGAKMCSIGKFHRNVIDLRTTSFIALILQGLFFVITFMRELTQSQNWSTAFVVNFVVLDGLVYLLAFVFFVFARGHDIPTRKDAAKVFDFYVSKVQAVQPRRPEHFNFPSQCLNHVVQNSPNARLVLPTGPDDFKIQEETRIMVEVQVEATQPNQSEIPVQTDSLQLKTRFWKIRAVSNDKTHPIVTICKSSAKVEPPAATISFPSEVLSVNVPSVETRLEKSVQRFSYNLAKF